jgi:hypothetical protein
LIPVFPFYIRRNGRAAQVYHQGKGILLGYNFLYQQGQVDTAQKYRERAEEHYQLLLKAQQERAGVRDRDRFKPHTLKITQVQSLKEQLAAYPKVKESYLVEKYVSYFPDDRFCVLGVIRKRGFLESSDSDQALIDLLVKNLQFPTQAYIVILNHANSGKLKKEIRQIPGSLIFQR